MSNSPLIPQENDPFKKGKGHQDRQEEIHYKRPDFIIIDDTQEYLRGSSNNSSFGYEQKQKGEFKTRVQQNPFSLRLLCFLGGIFCLIVGLGMLVFSVVLTLLALLLLFQHKKLNQVVFSFWKLYTNIVIAGLACIIGILNPAWGIGLLVLYFALSGEGIGSGLLSKIIKTSFDRF
ncbi:hypothetical protein [Candidatus Protochlamydia phocaeensis]|uniref:hypothetical protein n=1 Tax=Candidatus Protochlamydia phocaeensis TaxID=1414722 RepID=UPI000838503D|nr:hypothetical protein [Candidatus Protochlamydia phocaeensis]